MMRQASLFEQNLTQPEVVKPLKYPEAPAPGKTETSEAAAAAVAPTVAALRRKCLEAFARVQLSADECAEMTGLDVLTARPRVAELKKLGYITVILADFDEKTGKARYMTTENKSGKRAHVYRITTKGRAALAKTEGK